MKEEKYVVIVRGVLKFRDGRKIENGGLVPPDISADEIKDKLERKQIAVFDEELSAKVLSAKNEEIDIIKNLQRKNRELKVENDNLLCKNKELQKEIDGLLAEPKKSGAKK